MESKRINQFAVVAYVSGPLAEFVNGLRCELTPGCPHQAHITILPPRSLAVSAREGADQIRPILERFEPFEVVADGVSVFPGTHVLKLSISEGRNELRTLHDILNTGPFESEEAYPYVPHITLCMGIPEDKAAEFAAMASERWQQFGGEARLSVDALTFVQQREDETWADLEEMPIGDVRHQPVLRRR
jgi:2'-5' RNA ligase